MKVPFKELFPKIQDIGNLKKKPKIKLNKF